MVSNISDLITQELGEISLVQKIKMKPKKLKHYFFPIFGEKNIKVKLGKITIKDQLEAQKFKNILKPENIDANLAFLAWLANRLIKKCDPYWEKTDRDLIDMFTEESILQLSDLLKKSLPQEKKNQMKGIL